MKTKAGTARGQPLLFNLYFSAEHPLGEVPACWMEALPEWGAELRPSGGDFAGGRVRRRWGARQVGVVLHSPQ